MKNRKFKFEFYSSSIGSKANSSKFRSLKPGFILHNGIPAKPFPSTLSRPFTSTPPRKGDPLGFVALSFATPYPASLLTNPLAGSFILLMGMAATLFLATASLLPFFAQNPQYVEILRILDNIFGLYERFLAYEQNGIAILSANINNYTPETLTNFYFSLQELVTVRESLFNLLTRVINLPGMEFMARPVVDRANEIHEDLRLGGNNLMILLRDIEDRLNLPQEERIPTF
jgi:hypothetical protein